MKLAPLKGQGDLSLPHIDKDVPAIRPEEQQTAQLYSSLLSQPTSSGLRGVLTFLGTECGDSGM